ELMGIEMKPRWNGQSASVAGDDAFDRPLFGQALGKPAKVIREVVERDLRSAAKHADERPQFALLLHHQLLELVELGLERPPVRLGPLHRLQPKRGARQELNDAVVEIARQDQSRPISTTASFNSWRAPR